MSSASRTLALILPDQLSHDLDCLRLLDPTRDRILMLELWDDMTYVRHHKKKIILILSAMRHFADELRQRGFTVDYHYLTDSDPDASTLVNQVGLYLGQHEPSVPTNTATPPHDYHRICVTWPGEYRVWQQLKELQQQLAPIALDIIDDNRFLCTPAAFAQWAAPRKDLRMEFFYREMRQRHGILIEPNNQGGPAKPLGGKWNYDSENRKFPQQLPCAPTPYSRAPDPTTTAVIALVEQLFTDHFGDSQPFHFAVTAAEAQNALDHFITNRLPFFGDYQDAMLQDEPWLFHSHLSFYLNIGLLTARTCIDAAVTAYHAHQAPLNAVEGFVRQLLGWREYVRGIYWLRMPDYASANFLDAQRRLPDFFWTANTTMNCLKQCIGQTKQWAYAHHIQRLMVIGNFALLAGLDPRLVNEWFLIVYADAYEWVELPNVTGMILYADGGYLASKPYAASGAYINKMSNYCKTCVFKVTEKQGPRACPFNYLYWDFLLRHQDKLQGNPRLTMVYALANKKTATQKQQIRNDAQLFLTEIGIETV